MKVRSSFFHELPTTGPNQPKANPRPTQSSSNKKSKSLPSLTLQPKHHQTSPKVSQKQGQPKNRPQFPTPMTQTQNFNKLHNQLPQCRRQSTVAPQDSISAKEGSLEPLWPILEHKDSESPSPLSRPTTTHTGPGARSWLGAWGRAVPKQTHTTTLCTSLNTTH